MRWIKNWTFDFSWRFNFFQLLIAVILNFAEVVECFLQSSLEFKLQWTLNRLHNLSNHTINSQRSFSFHSKHKHKQKTQSGLRKSKLVGRIHKACVVFCWLNFGIFHCVSEVNRTNKYRKLCEGLKFCKLLFFSSSGFTP